MSILRSTLLMMMILISSTTMGQDAPYGYNIDLTQVVDDQLTVSLSVPDIQQKSIRFYMPKIIPGTYRESNFGRFVSEFKAYDKKGKELPVDRLDDNTWQIEKASKLKQVTYRVEDIYDTEKDNQIYRMSGTNIEEGKNFVINTPGFFGYFEDMKKIPFHVNISKPDGFYGSTGLTPVSSTSTEDVYVTADYDELVDSPLMYNIPDTTTIKIGDTDVLVSVYAPKGLMTSEILAEKFDALLRAEASYLGGDLPTDKYAFIMYFADPENASPLQGALEHNISSFYYLPEYPPHMLLPHIIDIAAHEFFHIVTPLTIHSKEIRNFDYNVPNLSKHLWLYEGVTEYVSDHVQVKYGITSPEVYLGKLAQKINNSRTKYKDNLPFTELSKHAAGEHASQYANVYEKGALIAAMLDLRLLELSGGKMSLMDLLNKLSSKYGKDKPFDDEELFSVIESLTYPEIGDFLETYVGGTSSLPFKEYFDKVGITMQKQPEKRVSTFGHVGLGMNQKQGKLMVIDISQMNEFGKKLGYKKDDLILKVKGQEVNPASASVVFKDFTENTKEGEIVEIEIGRKNAEGEYENILLSAPAQTTLVPGTVTLHIDEGASYEEQKLRNQWLMSHPSTAIPKDVKSIDDIIAAFYDVISGAAGERNWERFHSLFTSDARMSALHKDQQGRDALMQITTKEYQEKNTPVFKQTSFYESELSRKTFQYGGMANVQSVYAYTFTEGGEPVQRGVNSLQLIYHQGRWWINNVVWVAESPENPIPEYLLGEEVASK